MAGPTGSSEPALRPAQKGVCSGGLWQEKQEVDVLSLSHSSFQSAVPSAVNLTPLYMAPTLPISGRKAGPAAVPSALHSPCPKCISDCQSTDPFILCVW